MFDDVGDGQVGLVLDAVGDRERGEDDGQVRFDGVAGPVEYRPSSQIVLGRIVILRFC